MLRTFAILAAGLSFCATSSAIAAPVSSFNLDNGMEVVVIEDHRAPVVTHMVWYRIGAADEPAGKSGIAHFLEHLMFKGTEKFPDNQFNQLIADNGGQDNAFTSQDYTGYFQRIAADRLELVMELEADRMTGLTLTQDVIPPERQVILEERSQRVDNSPGSLFAEQRNAALYMNHPYGIPIIGWRHEMEELTLEDALDWYRAYYAPNNAILIVAGDVTPDQVKTLAQKYYGPIPLSDAIVPRQRTTEPPQLAERRITFSDARVRQPYIIRTYLAPERNAGDQKQAAALTILAEVLGGSGLTSAMGKQLQLEEKIAIASAAFYNGMGLDAQVFGVYAVPAPGVDLKTVEDGIDRVIETFIETGPDPEHLERIKNQIRAAEIFGLDDQQARARQYGAALTSGLTIEDVAAWPEILGEVTALDVVDAARTVLDRRKSVTGWLTGENQEISQ